MRELNLIMIRPTLISIGFMHLISFFNHMTHKIKPIAFTFIPVKMVFTKDF
jgi:hypothetical protein